MSRRNRGRGDGVAREQRARQRRARHQAAQPPRPEHPRPESTEASRTLVAALTEAGLTELAARAARLEFDENWSDRGDPLVHLYALLQLADQPDLAQRVTRGDFDATPADKAAYAATPQGQRDAAEFQRLYEAIPADVRARFEDAIEAVARDKAAQERMTAAFEARVLDDLGLSEPAPDDDAPVDPAQVHPELRTLLGARGPNDERLDTPEILAAAGLTRRSGGQDFQLGWTVDDVPSEQAGWYASVSYDGHRIGVHDQPGPNAAARALANRLLDGAQCRHCQRVVSLDPRGTRVRDKTLATGQVWTAAEQAEVGICVWRRRGLHWTMGCQPG